MILTMWTLFFLAALAVAVGSVVSANVNMAVRLRTWSGATLLARGGAEFAMNEILRSTNGYDGVSDAEWNSAVSSFKDNRSLPGGVFNLRYELETASGGFTTNCGVLGEECRINLNSASPALLTALFEFIGGVNHTEAEELAACVVDWRDEDDDVSVGGAERSYYQNQPSSYVCRNGPLRVVSELRLVKGVAQEVFAKVERFATVFGSGKINLNTAGPSVLRCVAMASGGNEITAGGLVDKLVRHRERGGVFKAPDGNAIKAAVGDLLPDEDGLFNRMTPFVDIRSTCFRGLCEGRSEGMGANDARTAIFVFDREAGDTLYWHED